MTERTTASASLLDGHWTITQNLFYVVNRLFAPRTYPRLLETGSGKGTQAWVSAGYWVTSVEHDEQWIGSVDGVRYVHAPLIEGFYDREILGRLIAYEQFDIWLLDGPPGTISDRILICDLLDKTIFIKPKLIIVDDCQRDDGKLVSNYLLKRFARTNLIHVPNTSSDGYEHEANIILI